MEYDVTADNYNDVYNALSTQQGLIHMTPSDPVSWQAAGHVDVFGTYKDVFDLRSAFQNNGTYQPHMIKYLRDISQKPGHAPGKVRVWRLEGTLPKPPKPAAPAPAKKGFWNWFKGFFGF